MAYVAQVSIRDSSHMDNAIEYVSQKEKALKLDDFKTELKSRIYHSQTLNTNIGDRATCINCSSQNTYMDFENMRKAFNQDKGVIAHHYYQSFQKDDNMTPEQAHQVGVELAKKMFPNFQIVVSTHTDREHLHNHIIVNSCNTVTGQKWYSNKKSLADIRKESDRLCLQNGLGIIDKNQKYKGIDRTTYQLGLKGKSWKINLVGDLEKAVSVCHSKDEFIKFLGEKDYTVRYKDMHITITKNGEKKGIRVDTLAKQFGEKFTKENLEKRMGYYAPPPPAIIEKYKPTSNSTPQKKAKPLVRSNWEHYEQKVFKQSNCLPSTRENIVRDKTAEHFFDTAVRSVAYSRNIFDFILRALALILAKRNFSKKKVQYKKVQLLEVRPPSDTVTFGNVDYSLLTQSSGDNFTVKVNLEYLLKIVSQPILYSARIDRKNSTVSITVKEKDKDFLANILELGKIQEKLETQNERIANQTAYKELKADAELSGEKLQYLIVTPQQLKVLKDHYIKFAYFEKDGKYNIAFLPQQTELIKKLAFTDAKQKPQETETQKNTRIYSQLKKSSAQSGEKLRYKIKITAQQLAELKETDITFAYFQNNDDKSLFNIAYEKSNEEKVKAFFNRADFKRS